MRLKEVLGPQKRLLQELTGRISNRLETEFADAPGEDGPNVGIALHERGRRGFMELPGALLEQAVGDPAARESVRVRIKSARDRMLFRPPPAPLPKHVVAAPDPAGSRFGFGYGRGQGRRR